MESRHYVSNLWQNTVTAYTDDSVTTVKVFRTIDGKNNPSTVRITNPNELLYNDTYGNTNISISRSNPFGQTAYTVDITPFMPDYAPYSVTFWPGTGPVTPTPTPTAGPSQLRTGSVIARDNNGTALSDYTVSAKNYYTGNWYNFTTTGTTATVKLPMDRITNIRNPDTGEYQNVAVGYYYLYADKSGYEMVSETPVQIAVMPEPYLPYNLGIVSMREISQPMSGSHMFRLIDASDRSVIQTGTIMLQSATTGIWYNSTFGGGYVAVILPYDTSDSVSEHAGNYYLYGAADGYETTVYPSQIVVHPRTVNEYYDLPLIPVGGIPEPGNVTFQIQVFSQYGPGIPNAEIFVSGISGTGGEIWKTIYTSSSGYVEIELPGNSTYDFVAKKSGYSDSRYTVTVTTETSKLIEIKMYGGAPPTVGPTTPPVTFPTTLPPGQTAQPTLTAPSGEPVDNYLEYFASHFGKILGGGVEIGKIFLWLCFATATGVLISVKTRSGALGLAIGALIVTLFFVTIGWVPLYLVALLLVVAGLVYGHNYMSDSYQGGGR